MHLEHPPGWGLAQRTHIQQVWRGEEGRGILAAGQQPILGFVLSTVKFTPNTGVSAPTPGLSRLHLTPQAQMQSLSPLAFLRSFLSRGLKFPGDLVSIPSCRSRGVLQGGVVSHLGTRRSGCTDFPRVAPALLRPIAITSTPCAGSCWGFTTEPPRPLSLPLFSYPFFSTSLSQTH